MSFEDDFLKGQRDCRNGVPHKPMQSEAYNRGYGSQYSAEQSLTEMGLRHGV